LEADTSTQSDMKLEEIGLLYNSLTWKEINGLFYTQLWIEESG